MCVIKRIKRAGVSGEIKRGCDIKSAVRETTGARWKLPAPSRPSILIVLERNFNMFCQYDIFDDLEDILCPLGREIKESGWCQIKNLCAKNECQICDQLYYWNDDGDQEGHEVADEPITNPHVQNQKWSQKDPNTHEYTERGVIKYKWSRYLRPAILATNKTHHSLGIKMLYQYNTFRFTRLVAQANNDWAEFCIRSKKNPKLDSYLLEDFLKTKVRLFDTPGASRPTRVRRSLLIKKLLVEDSDLDSDHYAKRGISKLPPRVCPTDKQRYVFYIVNKFIKLGGKLRDLTITMDDEEPGLVDQLIFEEAVMYHSEQSEERWQNFVEKSRHKVWSKNWSFVEQKVQPNTVAVDYVNVRGTDATSGGDLKFRYFEGRSRKINGIHVSGNYVPTSKVAKCLLKYFKTCCKIGLLQQLPIVSFTGKFTQRQLKDDGTWVSDDNLDDWLAERARQALEMTGMDGEEEDVSP
ncbi:hypothetical protein DL95DRAFT_504207 [Leptodontidium sp. 2 PMI_412]|nr:hypothetical protein DL95DRAFT_504207 [Leptodontidium sp. 2 PMI_412]